MSVDASQVKQAASSKWLEILSALGGIDSTLLDGKNHPCPRCGGTDRFRAVDLAAGALYCNQCHSKGGGDGLSSLQWLNGWDFPEAVKQTADYLGLANGNGRALRWDSTIGKADKPTPKTRPEKPNAKPRIVARYDYRNADGELVFQVCGGSG